MIPDHRKRKTRNNTPPHPHRVTIGEFGVYDESWVPFFHLSDDASSCEPCLDVWKRASLAADSLGRDRVLLLLHSLGHILDFKTISPKEAEKARLERERKSTAQYSKH